jgi:formylmethanofuran dehydrogenase subunit E
MFEKSLKKAAEFHGHVCPGLAIGVRAAELALKDLIKGKAKDEETLCIVENDSCAVDAVQALTGCTFGKGNLIFRDYGKQVYTFIKRPGGEAIRISVKWVSPEETIKEKEMWRRYTEGDRSEEVIRAVHQRKSRKLKAILAASEEELFTIKRFHTKPPCEARVFRSVPCKKCGEKTMETRINLLGGRAMCRPCFEKELRKCKS